MYSCAIQSIDKTEKQSKTIISNVKSCVVLSKELRMGSLSTENPINSWTPSDLFSMFYNDTQRNTPENLPNHNMVELDNAPQNSENDDSDIFSNRDIGDDISGRILRSNFRNITSKVPVSYGTSTNVIIDSDEGEPAEIIVSRVVFALLISISLVLNLLLILAVIRRRAMVHVIYLMSTFMLLPDLLFYSKIITELVDWSADAKSVPSWATSDTACGLWQFATHSYPIFYASFLLAIVFHAFVTLFLDYSGGYEERIKRCLVLIFLAICTIITLIVAPSGFYGKAKVDEGFAGNNLNVKNQEYAHFRQYCDLEIPTLLPLQEGSTEDIALVKAFIASESSAIYRLVYELVLPYLLPLILMGFPYVTLMIGLMRNAPAASHSEHSTKITVVVTLWLVTSYLMLHVPSVNKIINIMISILPV